LGKKGKQSVGKKSKNSQAKGKKGQTQGNAVLETWKEALVTLVVTELWGLAKDHWKLIITTLLALFS